MTATAPRKSTATPLPHETYTVDGERRALITVGTGHDCWLMDVPAALASLAAAEQDVPGSYFVERGLLPREDNDQLRALIADYLAQAKRHKAIPMTVFASTISLGEYAAAA